MNELRHLTEFQAVLKDYAISEQSNHLLRDAHLVLLAAPTSSGRNTIIRELLKTNKYYYIVSDTTRKPRVNDGVKEESGVEYWFRSEDEVLEDLRVGKFLEAAIIHNQQVSGISLRELQKAYSQKQIAITDIEIVGVANIVKLKPDTVVIFVVPPNFEEWRRRIINRGDMEPGEYKRRLESALKEFEHALEMPYYHLVVNDNLADTVALIDAVATTGSLDPALVAHNRKAVEQICQATQAHLQQLP